MAEVVLKKLEEELNCAICLDTYTDPKLLQCFHVFCRQCLVKLVVRNQQGQLILTCPTCRQATPIPANGVAGLQTAFHINHLLEIQESLKEAKDPVTMVTVVKNDEARPIMRKKVIPNCFEHADKERELYCETCEDLICWKCIMKGGKHHDHDYQPLNEAFEEYKREMTSLLEPMEEKLATIEDALKQFDNSYEEISNQREVIETNIHNDIRKLIKVLEVRKTELISKLHQITQRKLKSLASQRDQVETIQAQLRSCHYFVKESMKIGIREEVLMMKSRKSSVTGQVKELSTAFHPCFLKPNTGADIVYVASNDAIAAYQNYGQVYTPVNWLDPDKCLHEQGIKETSMLTLRKKFFFSDQKVDRNDPVQLDVLFVQSKDAIVDGTYPCTREEAIEFAALQYQIQYGNHNKAKYKPGFLNLVEFLPREYTKIRGIEKNIFTQHRKLHNWSEIDAKFSYIQLCRSLRTYGVTFFLVKDKMKGRKSLLGISQESIMCVDKSTKEVLKTWPFTTIRRWAFSPNSFTLDFGDYSESYSVKTTEGEIIAQLIAGFIDIIQNHREDEDESVIMDFEVDPKKGSVTTFTHGYHSYREEEGLTQMGVPHHASQEEGVTLNGRGYAQHPVTSAAAGILHQPANQPQNLQVKVLEAQKALQGNIKDGMQAVTSDLQSHAELPPLGADSCCDDECCSIKCSEEGGHQEAVDSCQTVT